MYKLVDTKDNSPSLVLSSESDDVSEMMHNSHGAFKESLYIYETALIEAHKKGLALEVYSLGLGLGYNEWISVGYCVKHNLPLKLQTSESELWLIQVLKSVLKLESLEKGYEDLSKAMKQVMSLVADHYSISVDTLQDRGKKIYESGQWGIHKALSTESLKELQPATVIFYDAFSKKMSPQLWDEEFLGAFLQHMSSEQGCVLSTYACTGTLKRALKHHGFKLIQRPGFEGKRESTLALK